MSIFQIESSAPFAGGTPRMSEAMHVYVDTEFTDFLDCDVISIAAVAADGREFYGERDDYDDMNCSVFVREAVLPQLGEFPDRVFTRDALRLELLAWLGQFPAGVLCFDDARDWDLLRDLLCGLPPGWSAQLVSALLESARAEEYYRKHGGRHHALHDARAIRYAANSGLRCVARLAP
jgi:hypothetical protein